MEYSFKRRGFTLVEILVAVGIIAVLAAIAMPQIQEVRKKSRDTARINDIGNIQLALRLYKDANSVVYPSGASYSSGVTVGEGGPLDTLILPYLPSVPKDPRGPGNATYKYVYNSNYSCPLGGGTVKVLYATFERTGTGNWKTVCDSSGSADIYGVVLR